MYVYLLYSYQVQPHTCYLHACVYLLYRYQVWPHTCYLWQIAGLACIFRNCTDIRDMHVCDLNMRQVCAYSEKQALLIMEQLPQFFLHSKLTAVHLLICSTFIKIQLSSTYHMTGRYMLDCFQQIRTFQLIIMHINYTVLYSTRVTALYNTYNNSNKL